MCLRGPRCTSLPWVAPSPYPSFWGRGDNPFSGRRAERRARAPTHSGGPGPVSSGQGGGRCHCFWGSRGRTGSCSNRGTQSRWGRSPPTPRRWCRRWSATTSKSRGCTTPARGHSLGAGAGRDEVGEKDGGDRKECTCRSRWSLVAKVSFGFSPARATEYGH